MEEAVRDYQAVSSTTPNRENLLPLRESSVSFVSSNGTTYQILELRMLFTTEILSRKFYPSIS